MSHALVKSMDEHVHMKVCLDISYILGMKPKKFKRRFFSHAHRVYMALLNTLFIFFMASECIEMFYLYDENLSLIVSNLSLTILYFGTLCKMYVCNGENVDGLIMRVKEKESVFLNHPIEEIREIHRRNTSATHFLNKTFIYGGYIALCMFFVEPLVIQIHVELEYVSFTEGNVTRSYPKRLFPFSCWFPFNRYKYYYASYSFQVLATLLGGGYSLVTDMLLVSLITYGIGQLKILKYCFEHCLEISRTRKGFGCVRDRLKATLSEFIVVHQDVIRYVEDIKNSMKLLMLVDFFNASLTLSMLGLQVITKGTGPELLMAVLFFITMIVKIFIYYWFSNEILVESQEIPLSIWNSPWYNFDEDIKKSLTLIIMRAQKPLSLMVGPFYQMSTETLVSLLKASYTYITLIQQVYSKKN